MSAPNYSFHYPDQCNMCGEETSHHHVLGKRLNKSQGKNPKRKTGITTSIIRCKSCGLVYCHPLPVPLDIADHYAICPEDYWHEHDLNLTTDIFLSEIRRVKQVLGVNNTIRSLDVGPGNGIYLKACTEAGFDASGCEPSESFYRYLIEKVGIPSKSLHLGKVEDIDFPDAYFDYISFLAVLEHLPDPSMAITRALRWLKPGGIISIEVPSSRWLVSKIFNAYYKLRCMDYTSHLSPMHPPYHLYEFDLRSFQKHAVIHGYEIDSHKYFVCETFMPRILDKPLKWLMKKTGRGMDLYLWLRKGQVTK